VRVFKAALLCTFVGFLLMQGGCASWGSGLRIENLERPLPELQKAISRSLPLGERRSENNGMEWFSKYFAVKGHKFIAGNTAPVRYYAQVYILGDRRPYVIEVYVKRQRRTSPQDADYADDGTDQQLAMVVQKRIQQQLSKRREDSNIIDDFRVF
jgi:hypothetical protein